MSQLLETNIFKQGFVAPARLDGEDDQAYLERVFLLFEQRLDTRMPSFAQGHRQQYDISEAGSLNVLIKPEHRVTNVVVIVSAGSGSYTFDFKVTEERSEDSKSGDVVNFFFSAPASVNPRVRILDQDGSVIWQKTFTVSPTDTARVTVTRVNEEWKV